MFGHTVFDEPRGFFDSRKGHEDESVSIGIDLMKHDIGSLCAVELSGEEPVFSLQPAIDCPALVASATPGALVAGTLRRSGREATTRRSCEREATSRLFDVLVIVLLMSAGALPLVAGGGEMALRLSGQEAARDRLWAALFFAGATIAILGTLASLLAAAIGWGL